MADINDFIDPKLISSLEAINEELKESGKIIDQVLVPAIKKLEEAQKKLGKNNDDNATKRKKLTADQKEAVRIAKQLETTQAKINGLRTEAGKKLTANKVELQKLTAETKRNLTVTNSLSGSYNKLNASLNQNIQKYKSLSAEQRNNKKVGGQLLNTIKQQDAALKKLDSSIGRNQRNVGAYGASIKRVALQFAGALGLTSAVFLFVNVLKGAFSTIRSFTKENAVLAGVLGVTRKEIKSLTDQAIQLGAVYPVTASEVVKLQVSFARLGFTMEEIQNLTEATIQGSIALNASLDQTATLVGAMVRAFDDLGTQDAGKIIDILTLATQKSSQSFETLKTALPKVAAAANAMGISLETVVDQLGIAQDATLDASISGTSLRNIYLELSKTGKTLDEALEEINTSSNRLRTSFELFGKRAAIVGLALAKNQGNATEFNKALEDVGGTADRVAKEQMATLDGAIKSLNSSWEKFILGLRGSEGFLSSFFTGLANNLDTVSDEFLTFGQKISILLGGVSGAQAKAVQTANKILLASIQTANEEQLNTIIDANRERADEGDKFSKKIVLAAKERIVAIAKSEDDGRKREELAKQNAELQKLAIEKEVADERVKNNKKETDAKIKEWEREVIAKSDAEKRKAQEELDERDAVAKDVADLTSDEDKEQTKAADEALKTSQDLNNQQQENREKETEDRKQRNEATRQAAFDLGNSIFDFRTSKLNAELAAAEGNEKKQAEIRARIAKAEKQKALFNIAINTARGITGALASAPPNIPLSIIVGAIGAVNALKVATTPIPQFASGVTNFGGGVAELAEKGSELVKESSGKVWLAENRGLYNLSQGTSVFPTGSQQTQSALNDKNIVKELKLTRRAIQNQPRQRTESRFDARRAAYWDMYNSRRMN